MERLSGDEQSLLVRLVRRAAGVRVQIPAANTPEGWSEELWVAVAPTRPEHHRATRDHVVHLGPDPDRMTYY